MEASRYIVFILTHGRADKVITYNTLREQGYTGRIGIVIDDEDEQGDLYRKNFGKENVFAFSKEAVSHTFDEVHKGDRRTIVYARNACFDIARQLDIKYFIELDDDYEFFGFTFRDDACFAINDKTGHVGRSGNIKDLDAVFSILLDYYESTPSITSLAMAQGGDFIGGGQSSNLQTITAWRKCMNSFICSTDRPFKFTGRINEDVNTYTMEAHRGMLFLTTNQVSLNQKTTQSNKGGMTDVYLDSGTFLKSFFSVICCPSAVKVYLIGTTQRRLHHQVSWNNCAPKILRQLVKK